MHNSCFICGLNRKEVDRMGRKIDFDEHINKQHNTFNYIFYIAYIRDKPWTELTGIESYVSECLEKNDVGWFPL
jgi:hypothetical protein